jgi:hypothetical protein
MSRIDANEIPLSQAARRLGLSWAAAWRLVLERELDAHQRPNGRWFVQKDSVDAYVSRQSLKSSHGRQSPAPMGHLASERAT